MPSAHGFLPRSLVGRDFSSVSVSVRSIETGLHAAAYKLCSTTLLAPGTPVEQAGSRVPVLFRRQFMTRSEALRRLAGTWRFELRRGRVRVRDTELLDAIEAVRAERVEEERAHHPSVPLPHEPMVG